MKGFAVASGPALLVLSAALAQGPASAPGPATDPWAGWRFLVGGWVGGGSGSPGEGSGSFSLQFDLDERILVRRSHTEYPGEGGKSGIVHDDLLVCYPDPAGGRILAIYFDNEGHVIQYAEVPVAPGHIVLVSEANPSSPRFRLSYTRLGPDALGIAFEVAPPGKPDGFVAYVTGKAVRSSAR